MCRRADIRARKISNINDDKYKLVENNSDVDREIEHVGMNATRWNEWLVDLSYNSDFHRAKILYNAPEKALSSFVRSFFLDGKNEFEIRTRETEKERDWEKVSKGLE